MSALMPGRGWAIGCIAASFLGLAPGARAQVTQAAPPADAGRTAVFGGGGYNTQWDDESSLGRAIAVNGGIGYRVAGGFWIEGVVNRLEHRRPLHFYTVSQDAAGHLVSSPYAATLTGSATYALAQARYVFNWQGQVRPYVAYALGVMHYSGNGWSSVLPRVAGQPQTPDGVSTTARATGGTAGMEMSLSRRVSIGPYVGLLLAGTGETGTKMALHGGIRAGFLW